MRTRARETRVLRASTSVGRAGSRRWGRLTGAAAVVAAGAVASTGLSVAPTYAADPGMSVAPMPVTAVSLAHAGELTVWGQNDRGQATVPASLSGVAVTQVAVPEGGMLALTAAGTVVGWGGTSGRIQNVPAAVAATDVVQIAANASTYAAAVTRDGAVLTWGLKKTYPTPLDVPASAQSGVAQVALSYESAVALKSDGSVVAWGRNDAGSAGMTDVPAELKVPGAATAVATGNQTAFALTAQGTVVAWGNGSSAQEVPASVQAPGNVKAIAATSDGALAILTNGTPDDTTDDTLVGWGVSVKIGPSTTPASVLDAEPVSITAGSGGRAGMVDRDGVIHNWFAASGAAELNPAPESLDGVALAQFGVSAKNGAAVVTKMLRGALPTMTGSATVGDTLTGTPGTFSASPDTVASRWLADGAPIPGSTGATLPVTAALVGKKITYESTATKTGEATISSVSTPVTVTESAPLPVPKKVASKTKVGKIKVAKKAKKVTVAGKVTASKPVAGKATVTIKKGKKAILAKAVKVNAKGAVKLTVKKFAKLVAKKAKAKGKKAKGKKAKGKTAYRGKYTVTIAYAGNAQVKPSKAGKAFKVKK